MIRTAAATAARTKPAPAGFPARLRELRQQHGLSQGALAERIGKTAQTVSLLESGKQRADLDIVEALAAAIGVEPAWLAYGCECNNEQMEDRMLSLSSKSEVRALATHAYYDYLASQSRPLSPASPAEYERADDEWDTETIDLDRIAAAAREKIADVSRVLSVLSDEGPAGQRARGIARDQLNRLGCNRPFTLRGYGLGWKEMPKVSV